MREREVAIGVDRPAKPLDCFLVLRKMELRRSGAAHPVMGSDIAGAEAQRLEIVALRLLGPPQRSLCHTDQRMCVDEVAIKDQRMLELGNGLRSAIDGVVERAKHQVRPGVVGCQRYCSDSR